MTFDPRLRVLYLLAVALGVFLLRAPWQLGALVVGQMEKGQLTRALEGEDVGTIIYKD